MADWSLLKYHLLPYCDLMSLMRLCWTNQTFRVLLNQPDTVVEWQRQCWFLYRECQCDRNLFYLRSDTYCDFAFDWNLTTMNTQFECDMYLRMFGRSVTMLMVQQDQPQQVPSRYLPFLYPQKDTKRFRSGVFQTWLEDLIVPVPRMVGFGVENVYVRPMDHPRTEAETEDLFRKRVYWRNFHDVDDVTSVQNADFDIWSPTDLVQRYYDVCAKTGRDPHDPMDDPECEGHCAAAWARRCMYQTPVGVQHYPLELCMRKEDIEPPKAQRDGVDYLDRLFLPLRPFADGHSSLLEHHGPVYFSGVRYDNEKGDFINWAMSTHAVLHAFYRATWFDVCLHFIKLLTQTLRHYAYEIEADLPLHKLTSRWQYVEHLRVCNHCQHDTVQGGCTWESMQNQDAIYFLQEGCYTYYHNVVRRTVAEYIQKTQAHRPSMEIDPLRSYLTNFIPNVDNSVPRSEVQLVVEMHYLLELGTYLTRFAATIAPRVSGVTLSTRRSTMQIYLASALPLMTFSPTWMQSYHWKPSLTNRLTSLRVPFIDLTLNHRFRKYLQFTHARTMYYHDHDVSMVLEEHTTARTQHAQQGCESTKKQWHEMVLDTVQPE